MVQVSIFRSAVMTSAIVILFRDSVQDYISDSCGRPQLSVRFHKNAVVISKWNLKNSDWSSSWSKQAAVSATSFTGMPLCEGTHYPYRFYIKLLDVGLPQASPHRPVPVVVVSSGFPRPSFYCEGGPSRMMNRQKIQTFSANGKVLRSRTNSVKNKERNASKNKLMSTETQYFIQKICYRKTASIDMTRHGFINDSKVDPVNHVMKALKAQLEKICVKPVVVKPQFSPVLPRANLREAVTPTSTERKPPCIPKSALSCSGCRSPRTRCRVRIQSESNPDPGARQKRVRLVSPIKNKVRTPIKKK